MPKPEKLGKNALVMTVANAKKWLASHFTAGKPAICPCCAQLVKRYPRKVNNSMAQVLFLIHRTTPDDQFVHVSDLITEHRPQQFRTLRADWPKFRYWGILESEGSYRDDGSSRNGFWRITEKGRQFLRGEIDIIRTRYVYNDTLLPVKDGEEKHRRTIHEALGEGFDYNELMRRDA